MTAAQFEGVGEPAPLRWSNERYLALVESGAIAEGHGVELIDGQVTTSTSQGKLHGFSFLALQRAFATMGAFANGLSVQPTVIVAEGEVYDPEFVLLRLEYTATDLPQAADLLWVIEVSVTSRRTDLGAKKAAYACAGIPTYWVVDAIKRGVWVFTNPVDGEYRNGVFAPAGESIQVPVLGTPLDSATIFPAS